MAGNTKPNERIDTVVMMVGSVFAIPRRLTSHTSTKGTARIG